MKRLPDDDIDSFLRRFSKQHSVLLDALPEAERLGIYYAVRCQDALEAGLAALSADVLSSDAVVGVARQFLARCAEHVEGALAAFEQELLGSRPPEKWPAQVSERFRELDDEVTYRTVYARLCSETHFDAQETLRYGLGQLGGNELLERMAVASAPSNRTPIAVSCSEIFIGNARR